MPESRTDAHHGAEWTLCEDFFIAEDGQGEDRLIVFAMSSLTLLLLYVSQCIYIQNSTKNCQKGPFLGVGEMLLFGLKVGKTGVS